MIGLENKSAVTSRRPKFVFIAWIGSETPIIERARVSTINSQVREFFCVCAFPLGLIAREPILVSR